MRRWLNNFLTIVAVFALAFVVLYTNTRTAHAETVLLLDTSAGVPLDTFKAAFTAAPLNMTTVSRAAVYSDPAKLSNLSAYKIVVLYQFSYYGANPMPDWAKTALNDYVVSGGVLIGTGVDELYVNGNTDYNFASVFHIIPATTVDLMTHTTGWNARLEEGMANHPIANNVYGAYPEGEFTTNAICDMDAATEDEGTIRVFGIEGWYSSNNGVWSGKVTVWETESETNNGTAIWWNGNGNRSTTHGEMITEWTTGVMVPAFQNMMHWAMGLAGYELTISTDAPANNVGYPSPGIGMTPQPRQYEMTCSVSSPWSEAGVTDERYLCTGWTGDGIVVPATGTDSTVTFEMTDHAWITWHWIRQYQITVTTTNGIGAPASEFEYWQEAFTFAHITTTANISTGDDDLAWRLFGWIGTGSAPALGSWTPEDDPVCTFYCDGAATIEWQWIQTYRLQVFNPQNVGVPYPTTGATFFDQNTTILAYVQTQVYQSSSIRYNCNGFVGTGAVPTGGMNNAVTFVLYTPSTISWNWSNEYRLDVSNPGGLGSPSPAAGYYWYPEDEIVTCSISSPMVYDDVNYMAVGYTLNGATTYFDNTNNPSVTLTMSGPNEFEWIVEPSDVILNINSAFGSPVPAAGQHTYTYGDEITLDVDEIVMGASSDVRYVCQGFIATGNGIVDEWQGVVSGDSREFSYTFNLVSSPTTVTWLWTTEYLLIINSNLTSITATPDLGSHWIEGGSTVNASSPKYIPGYECIGFLVNKGSIAATDSNYVSFVMTEPVAITWSWDVREDSPLAPALGSILSLSPEDPDYGRYSSIAVDPTTNYSYIAYYRSYDDGGGSLYCVFYNGSSWITELVDGRGSEAGDSTAIDYGQYASVALDSNGRPHIAYYDASHGFLRYAHRTVTGNWELEIVDDGDGSSIVGEFCSLAIDRLNTPSISYYNRTRGNLCYAKLVEENWEIESPVIIGNVGSSTKIVLDPVSQAPRIVFRDNENNDLYFVYHDGSEWIQILIDDSGKAGTTVGLALDSAGMAHVVFQAFLGNVNRLMYAVQSGENFFSEILEESVGTGYYPEIGILNGNFPVIAYNDQSEHALKYKYFDGDTWYTYTVDNNGEAVGWYVSVDISDSKVYTSYWTNKGLRFTVLQHEDVSASTNDGESSGGGGGCFIATAAFGSYASSSVRVLTGVRDGNVSSAVTGSAFVSLYYNISPAVANSLSDSGSAIIRRVLSSLVK